MLEKQTLVAFIATSKPASARKFYTETLGLQLVSDDPYALVFDAKGTTIRVQKVEHFEPQPFTALGWTVNEIVPLVLELSQRSVKFERFAGLDQDDHGIWNSPSGARVAWFKDPDGNTLSLTQL